jgi:hypothetical protein
MTIRVERTPEDNKHIVPSFPRLPPLVIPASLSGNLCQPPQVPAEERTGMTFILNAPG